MNTTALSPILKDPAQLGSLNVAASITLADVVFSKIYVFIQGVRYKHAAPRKKFSIALEVFLQTTRHQSMNVVLSSSKLAPQARRKLLDKLYFRYGTAALSLDETVCIRALREACWAMHVLLGRSAQDRGFQR